MSPDEAHQVVNRLGELVGEGYTLLTWNGLGFDFDVLAEESDALDQCRGLALEHVDMMFHIFCDRGFPVALGKAAEAMNIPGKPEGMSGVLAPRLWAQQQFQEVMHYVAQDVRMTLQVAQACDQRRAFEWITRRGTKAFMPLQHGWVTVRDALRIPEPDNSWMSDPLPRQRFTEWLNK